MQTQPTRTSCKRASPQLLRIHMLIIGIQLALLKMISAQNTSAASDEPQNATDKQDKFMIQDADDVTVAPSVAATAAIVLGLVMCFFGYRFFRPALFTSGFLLGGLLGASVIQKYAAGKSWEALATWLGLVACGIVAGALVMVCYEIGIFAVGAAGGVFLAFTLHPTLGPKIYADHPDVALIIMAVVLGLVCGLLAYWLEKPVLILGTSLVGAHATVWGIGYFAGGFPDVTNMESFRLRDVNGKWFYSVPKDWWWYVGGIVVLFFLGAMIQVKRTAKDVQHPHPPKKEKPIVTTKEPIAKPQYGTAVKLA